MADRQNISRKSKSKTGQKGKHKIPTPPKVDKPIFTPVPVSDENLVGTVSNTTQTSPPDVALSDPASKLDLSSLPLLPPSPSTNLVAEPLAPLLPPVHVKPHVFKIDTTYYDTAELNTMLSDPYEYMKDKDVGVILNFTKLFEFAEVYKDDDAESEFILLVHNYLSPMMVKREFATIMIMLVNEYFLPDNVGGNYKNLYNIVFLLLLTCHITSNKKSLALSVTFSKVSPDAIKHFLNLLPQHITFIRMFMLSPRYAEMLEPSYLTQHKSDSDKFVKMIIDEVEVNPVLLPFARFGHQMAYSVRKNKNGNGYIICFMNSGDGINRHRSQIIGSKQYTKAINEYRVGKDVLMMFLTSIAVNIYGSVNEFYSSVIFLLESNSVSSNLSNNTVEMTDNKEIEKYYYEPQVTGNCVARSFLLPLYMYSTCICEQYNNFYEELIFFIKMMLAVRINMVYNPSSLDNMSYVLGTYVYHSIQKYIDENNISRIPIIYELSRSLGERYSDTMKKGAKPYMADQIENIKSNIASFTDQEMNLDVTVVNQTKYLDSLSDLRYRISSQFVPFIEFCMNHKVPTPYKIDETIANKLPSLQYLSTAMASANFVRNERYITYPTHADKVVELALGCKVIFRDCFGIEPAQTSNRFLNKIFRDYKYINPAMYDDFVSAISQKINYADRKIPVLGYVDHLFDVKNYEVVAKKIWTIVTGSPGYKKDIDEQSLIQAKYDMRLPKSILDTITDDNLISVINKSDTSAVFLNEYINLAILYTKEGKRYYVKMPMNTGNPFTLITTKIDPPELLISGKDGWVDKFVKKATPVLVKVDVVFKDVMTHLHATIDMLTQFIDAVHEDEYVIEQYIHGQIPTLPVPIKEKHADKLVDIEKLAEQYKAMSVLIKRKFDALGATDDFEKAMRVLIPVFGMFDVLKINNVMYPLQDAKLASYDQQMVADIIDLGKNFNTNKHTFMERINTITAEKELVLRAAYARNIVPEVKYFHEISLSYDKKHDHKMYQYTTQNLTTSLKGVATFKELMKSIYEAIFYASKKWINEKGFLASTLINKRSRTLRELHIYETCLSTNLRALIKQYSEKLRTIEKLTSHDDLWALVKRNIASMLNSEFRAILEQIGALISMTNPGTAINKKNDLLNILSILDNDINATIDSAAVKTPNVCNVITPDLIVPNGEMSCVVARIINNAENFEEVSSSSVTATKTQYNVDRYLAQPYHYTILLNIYSSGAILGIPDIDVMMTKLLYLDIITYSVMSCIKMYYTDIKFKPLQDARKKTITEVKSMIGSFGTYNSVFSDLIDDLFDDDKSEALQRVTKAMYVDPTTIFTDVSGVITLTDVGRIHIETVYKRLFVFMNFLNVPLYTNKLVYSEAIIISMDIITYILRASFCINTAGIQVHERYDKKIDPLVEHLLNKFTNSVDINSLRHNPIIDSLAIHHRLQGNQVVDNVLITPSLTINFYDIENKNKQSVTRIPTDKYSGAMFMDTDKAFVLQDGTDTWYYLSPAVLPYESFPFVLFDIMFMRVKVTVVTGPADKVTMRFVPGDYDCIPIKRSDSATNFSEKDKDYLNRFKVRCTTVPSTKIGALPTDTDTHISVIYHDDDGDFYPSCNFYKDMFCEGQEIIHLSNRSSPIFKVYFVGHNSMMKIKKHLLSDDTTVDDVVVAGDHYTVSLDRYQLMNNEYCSDMYGYSSGMYKCRYKDRRYLVIMVTWYGDVPFVDIYQKNDIWPASYLDRNLIRNRIGYYVKGNVKYQTVILTLNDRDQIELMDLRDIMLIFKLIRYSSVCGNFNLYTTLIKLLFNSSIVDRMRYLMIEYDMSDGSGQDPMHDIKTMISYGSYPYTETLGELFYLLIDKLQSASDNNSHISTKISSNLLTKLSNLPFPVSIENVNFTISKSFSQIVGFSTSGDLYLTLVQPEDLAPTVKVKKFKDLNPYQKALMYSVIYNNNLQLRTEIENVSNSQPRQSPTPSKSTIDTVLIVVNNIGIKLIDYIKDVTGLSIDSFLRYANAAGMATAQEKESSQDIQFSHKKDIRFVMIRCKIPEAKSYIFNKSLDDAVDELRTTVINLAQPTQIETYEPTVQKSITDFIEENIHYKNVAAFDPYTRALQSKLTAMIDNCDKMIKSTLKNAFEAGPRDSVLDMFFQNLRQGDMYETYTNEMLTLGAFFLLLKKKYEDILKDLTGTMTSSDEQVSKDIELRSLIDRCMSVPSYVKIADDVMVFDVNSLVVWFEYFFEGFGRRSQMDLIQKILENDANIVDKQNIHQLIMGAGKSSFIAPLLSLLLCAQSTYPLHVMPEYLIPQSLENMEILNNFGITTIALNGSSLSNNDFVLQTPNTQLINFVIGSSDLKTMMLRVTKTGMYDEYKILKSSFDRCFIVFDEVDDISDPFKNELNYPTNIKRGVTQEQENDITVTFDILSYLYFAKCMNKRERTSDSNEFFDTPHPYYSLKIGIDTIQSIMVCADKEHGSEPTFLFLAQKMNHYLGIEFFVDKTDTTAYSYKELATLKGLTGDVINRTLPLAKENVGILRRLKFLQELFKRLSSTFTKVNRKDFGLLYEDGFDNHTKYPLIPVKVLNKANSLAIPFKVINDPIVTSTFSDPLLTIIYTIMSHILNKEHIFRNKDIDQILTRYYTIFKTYNPKEWTVSNERIEYNRFINTMLDVDTYSIDPDEDPFTIVKYHDYASVKSILKSKNDINFNNVKSDALDLILSVFRKYNTDNEYQFNICFSDIVQSDLCRRRTGFSGTPYFEVPYDRTTGKQININPLIDSRAEGSIFYTCVQDSVSVVKIPNVSVVFDIIADKKYIALIDIGATFVGYTSKDVARIINNKRKIPVIYLDDDNEKVVFDPTYKIKAQSEAVLFSAWLSDKGLTKPPKDSFVFFDQKHITGIDFKLPLMTYALILVNHKNGARDFGQGAFRMRQINNGQNLTIGITNTLANIISHSDDAVKNRKNLLTHMRSVEDKNKKSKKQLQSVQNIRAMYRQYILQKHTFGCIFGAYDYLNKNAFIQRSKAGPIESIDDYDKRYEDFIKQETLFMAGTLKNVKSTYSNVTVDALMEDCDFDNFSPDMENIQEQEQEQEQEMEREQNKEQEQEQEHINMILNLKDKLNDGYTIKDFKGIGSNGSSIKLSETPDAASVTFVQLDGIKGVYLTSCLLADIIKYEETVERTSKRESTTFSFKIVEEADALIITTIDEFEQYIAYTKKEALVYNPTSFVKINALTRMILNMMGRRSGNQVTFIDILAHFVDLNEWPAFMKNISQYIQLNAICKAVLNGMDYVISNKLYMKLPSVTQVSDVDVKKFVTDIVKIIGETELTTVCGSSSPDVAMWKSFVKGAMIDKPSDCTERFTLIQNLFKMYIATRK